MFARMNNRISPSTIQHRRPDGIEFVSHGWPDLGLGGTGSKVEIEIWNVPTVIPAGEVPYERTVMTPTLFQCERVGLVDIHYSFDLRQSERIIFDNLRHREDELLKLATTGLQPSFDARLFRVNPVRGWTKAYEGWIVKGLTVIQEKNTCDDAVLFNCIITPVLNADSEGRKKEYGSDWELKLTAYELTAPNQV